MQIALVQSILFVIQKRKRRKIEQLIRFKAVSFDAGYEQRIIALLPAPQISNEVVRGLFCDSSRFMDKAMALGDVECMHSLLL